MAFTEKQAKAKAQQIFERFGELIHLACANSVVDDSFLAGFVAVEAGIDSHGNIKPDATRFEPGVYQDLISLRDHGYCFVGGRKLTNYSGVRQSQIKDASDEAIRALATSYSFSQIMGWHVINNLHCSIADLRDRNKHFHYTVKLLKIVGGKYLERGDLASVLKIWNTGSANGKTYHLDYVDNALLVKKHYAQILKDNRNAFHQSSDKVSPDSFQTASVVNSIGTANNQSPLPPTTGLGKIQGNVFIDAKPYSNSGASPALQEPVQSSGNAPTSTADGSEQNLAQNNQPNGTGSPDSKSTQTAENITNVDNSTKTVPDNFTPQNIEVSAPPPSGMMAKAAYWVGSLGIGVPSLAGALDAVKSWTADGTINVREMFAMGSAVAKFVFPYAVYLGIAFVVFWGIKELMKQISLMLKIYITGRADTHNVEVIPIAAPVAETTWKQKYFHFLGY